MWSNFHFLYPWFLVLLLALPLIGWWLYSPKKSHWQQWVDATLVPYVLTGKGDKAQYWQLSALALAWVLGVVALAGPTWQKRDVPVYENPHALVIALDLSLSMWAKDVAPDRLSQARFKVLDILNQRKEGQTGLIVFAGDAFVVTPLTSDTATIAEQIKNLSPDIMPALGSHLAPAIVEAQQLLTQTNLKQGDILLITDGADDVSEAQQAATQTQAAGFTVSTLAIGTEKGAPIPIPNQGFLKDQTTGNTVMAEVNKTALASIASAGQGLALEPSVNDNELSQLQVLWQQHLQAQAPELKQQQVEIWLNAGYWLLIPLLPLVLGIFRRGWLVLLCGLLLSTRPDPVLAFEVQDLFKTPDQRAMESMLNKDFKTAEQQFKNPDWKAAAAYEGGDWEQAAHYYKDQNSNEGRYNYANSLAKQGKLEEAIKAYDQVLKQNPKYEDAVYNRKLVEEALKKQQQPSQKDQQNQQKKQDQQNQSSKQSGSSSQPNQNPSDSNQQGSGQDQRDQPPSAKDEPTDKDQKAEAAEQKPAAKRPEADKPNSANQASDEPPPEPSREQQQATEQWLRRIPDDPAELWRRKFLYQYQQRTPQQQGAEW
jgi:Ca-activated chloride channel family protein